MNVRRAATVLVAAALLGAACGGSSDRPEASPDAAPVSLPAVEVLDVATGAPTQFAELLPADRPVLLWFWAPH